MIDNINQRRYPVRFMSNKLVLLFILLGGLCYGCSFPRIIVLEDPLTPEEHLNLGVAYEKRGEFDAARKEYKAASPHLPMALVYLGNVYFMEGNTVEAEKSYQLALAKDPLNADAHNNLAWLYLSQQKKLDEAHRLVLRALELNPAKAGIYRDTLEKIEQNWKR
jgi:tetratricopeptide (TPR) repeat protein